jgi:YspA, cpYpsA-related SLOG family
MRVLVCGGRGFYDWRLLEQTLYELNKEDEINDLIHGGANGADSLAHQWGLYNGVSIHAFPADWEKYGKAAGPIRNKQMLDEGKPDLVVAFIGPGSKGTRNMVDQAKKAGVPVKEVEI